MSDPALLWAKGVSDSQTTGFLALPEPRFPLLPESALGGSSRPVPTYL